MSDDTHSPSTVPLAGSGRAPRPDARVGGGVAPGSRVEATIVLRRRAELDVGALPAPLSREQLASQYGASDDDVAALTSWARSAGLTVESVDQGSRRIRVAGDIETVARAFGTDLRQAELDGVSYRQRTGDLHVPAELADVVVAVLGVDDRPQARSRAIAVPRAEVSTSYTPPQLAKIYAMPDGADGTGQHISIIELGGGYADDELATYFASIGVPAPTVTSVGVDGGRNVPGGDPNGADGEVLLDIEVAGGIAPGATITVYFAPNTDAGFLDAVSQAAHADPTPTAISISWGQSEDDWTSQARTALDAAMADAGALGASVTVAAGDDGSADRTTDGAVHVEFPASSPHALACGGTTLTADPATGEVSSETVWGGTANGGATGGGVSAAFALPSWQQTAGIPARSGTSSTGRGVPDVSAAADPRTGYEVLVDGNRTVIGGTSAVAPLWAALLCRLAQALGKPLGLAQAALYAGVADGAVAPGFRDIVTGNNGAYTAAPGWDACTGLGVPDGQALLTALSRSTTTV
ncbi:MAG: kumamolisin [Pseudonocardiales bacterium]|nr:kumamolisin [Pseudonocardiales bacterium]